MKLRAKKLLALAMAGVMTLSLAGCGGSGSSGGSGNAGSEAAGQTGEASSEGGAASSVPKSAEEVVVPEGESVSQEMDVVGAMNVDFTTMDPMDTSDTLSGGIQRLMMDGLFGFDDNMKIIPMLATDYEANENATEYVIHLRQGISFTDGTPFNAEAAKANLDRWGDKELGLKRTTLLCNVLESTEIVDEYTVRVKQIGRAHV